jgi:L-rhamnose mutarotase
LSIIKTLNNRNYLIFLCEPENLLFSYFEYHGTDFVKDMAHPTGFEPVTPAFGAKCLPPKSLKNIG